MSERFCSGLVESDSVFTGGVDECNRVVAPGMDDTVLIHGEDGASAYEIAVENGFRGSEAEWLASLVGPRGPYGPAGPQGEQGPRGAEGPVGPAPPPALCFPLSASGRGGTGQAHHRSPGRPGLSEDRLYGGHRWMTRPWECREAPRTGLPDAGRLRFAEALPA